MGTAPPLTLRLVLCSLPVLGAACWNCSGTLRTGSLLWTVVLLIRSILTLTTRVHQWFGLSRFLTWGCMTCVLSILGNADKRYFLTVCKCLHRLARRRSQGQEVPSWNCSRGALNGHFSLMVRKFRSATLQQTPQWRQLGTFCPLTLVLLTTCGSTILEEQGRKYSLMAALSQAQMGSEPSQ